MIRKPNPKLEIRNKAKCSKNDNVPNNFNSDSAFWIFFGFGFIGLRFVSVRGAAFVLRISNFLSTGGRMLKGKKIIAIGERDGVPGPVIAECLEGAGYEVIFQATECFV